MIMAQKFLMENGNAAAPLVRVKEGQPCGDEVYDKCFGIVKAAAGGGGGGAAAAAPAFGQHALRSRTKSHGSARPLHTGSLLKKEGLRNKWNERFFALHPDQLIFFVSEGGEERGSIPLDAEVTARESECPGAMPGEIEIILAERTIRIRSMRGDRDVWLAKINEVLPA